MSQNPFAPHSHDSFGAPPATQKTSGLAIAALVCSLIVCVPGLGVIGLILGLIAMFTIGSSDGRVRGKGLAAAAIILGLLVSTAWIGGGIAFYRANEGLQKHVHEPTYSAFKKLDAGDVSEFRALLTPNLAAAITDAEILAFHAAYQDKVGACQGQPQDIQSAFAMVGVISDGVVMTKLQQAASSKGVIPVAASFSKNPGAIIIASDSITGGIDYALATPTFTGTVVDVAVGTAGQPVIYLSDFIGKKLPPTPTPASTPDVKPTTPPPAPGAGG